MHSFGIRIATVLLVTQQQISNVSGFVAHPIRNIKYHHYHDSMTQIKSASLEGDIVSGVDVAAGTATTTTAETTQQQWKLQPPDMVAYASGYTTANELPFAVCAASEGAIPEDLVGTYYRSGPAMFSAGSLVPPKASIVQPKQPPTPDGVNPDRMVLHPFEGDGAILGITFNNKRTDDDDDDESDNSGGGATARFRYVRTNAFTNERRKGMRLYTGMDNTRQQTPSSGNDFPVPLYRHHFQSGLNKKRKNASNTRAIYWSKKLLTLWEGGLPYKLDALALSTEGRSQLGGILLEASPFGAKSIYDPKRNNLLLYSNAQNPSKSSVTLFEFNSKFRLVNAGRTNEGQTVHELPGFAILSDFAATDNYALFVQPPTTVNSMQYNFVSKDPGQSVKVETIGPSMLHIVKRVTSERAGGGAGMKTIEIPFDGISDADLQFCNAYENDAGDEVVFDAIRSDVRNIGKTNTKWPWAQSLKEFADTASTKSLWRYTIHVKSGALTKKQCLSDLQTSFATINPQYNMQSNYQYIYTCIGAMGNDVAPPQGIAKFNLHTIPDNGGIPNKDVDMWLPKEYEFCGEPMFAPRKKSSNDDDDEKTEPKEDDGYIISILYNGKTKSSSVIIFNAERISSGPVARIPLGIAVPHGLHGCFTADEEACWTEEEISRRAKLSDKMESRGNMWNEVKSDFSGLGLRLDDFEEYFGDIL